MTTGEFSGAQPSLGQLSDAEVSTRYQETNGRLRDMAESYPEDGTPAERLIWMLEAREVLDEGQLTFEEHIRRFGCASCGCHAPGNCDGCA